MKYLVDIKDTSYATVEVEANSKEQAEEIAYTRYYEGTMRSWDMVSLRIKTMLLYRAQREFGTGDCYSYISMMSVISDITPSTVLNFVPLC